MFLSRSITRGARPRCRSLHPGTKSADSACFSPSLSEEQWQAPGLWERNGCRNRSVLWGDLMPFILWTALFVDAMAHVEQPDLTRPESDIGWMNRVWGFLGRHHVSVIPCRQWSIDRCSAWLTQHFHFFYINSEPQGGVPGSVLFFPSLNRGLLCLWSAAGVQLWGQGSDLSLTSDSRAFPPLSTLCFHSPKPIFFSTERDQPCGEPARACSSGAGLVSLTLWKVQLHSKSSR